jgi:casein kinase II subunit alpha
VLGTNDLFEYLKKYDIELDSSYDGVLGKYSKKPFTKFVTNENSHLVSQDALDLLENMLIYDHVKT